MKHLNAQIARMRRELEQQQRDYPYEVILPDVEITIGDWSQHPRTIWLNENTEGWTVETVLKNPDPVKHGELSYMSLTPLYGFYFKNDHDAVAFKLRWC